MRYAFCGQVEMESLQPLVGCEVRDRRKARPRDSNDCDAVRLGTYSANEATRISSDTRDHMTSFIIQGYEEAGFG